MNKVPILICSILCTTFSWLWSQNNPGVELLAEDCMEGGSASIMVLDLESGAEVYEFDASRALPTASIQKFLTTAAVLQTKGPDFRYKTIVGYSGHISDGRLNGNLIIIGSGDPTLGSGYFEEGWNLDKIADTLLVYLQGLGIQQISGDVVIDVSISPGQHVPGGWPWADLGNYYGAGHWGLNIHDNEYRLFFQQNQILGQPTKILRTLPDVTPFVIHNEVQTGPVGSGDQAYIYAAPYSTYATVRGTIPPGTGSFSIRGSLTNPPQFFGERLKILLEESGVAVSGGIEVTREPVNSVQILFILSSPPLLEIARVTNHRSVNLYAEALLKLLCDEDIITSQYACGLDRLEEFWSGNGLDNDQIFYRDGSGLSPRNTASAASFVRALQAVFENPDWFKSLFATLPEMGKDGTLQYMLRGYHGTGRIHAKSGYIGRQRSYAGYMSTEKGRTLAFCIMLDNYNCSSTRMRQRIERFLIALMKE